MPLPVQAKLLRVLQDKCVQRVGGSASIPVNVRIVCASNRNLQEMVAQGTFRNDLYYRLNVIPIHIPPLRLRREDIPVFIESFLARYRRELRRDVRGLDPVAYDAFMGTPTTVAYVLVATLGVPALRELGFSVLSSHFFVFYFGVISMVTPPVAVAAYAGAEVAGASMMRTGLIASRLCSVAFIVPFFFMYDPALLMQGEWPNILQVFVTATIGTVALAGGMTLRNTVSGDCTELEVAGVFVCVGIEPNTAFLDERFLRADGGWLATDVHLRTSVPGVFAAGDVRDTPLRQIVTAAADGALAAISAYHWLQSR